MAALVLVVICSFILCTADSLDFVSLGDDDAVRIALKAICDVAIIAIAIMGAILNKRYRNQLIVIALVLYAVADALSTFEAETLFGGPLYVLGHLVVVYAIYVSSHTTKRNARFFFLLMVGALICALIAWPTFGVFVFAMLAYGVVLNLLMALSLGNPYYFAAALMFVAADTFGVLRLSAGDVLNSLGLMNAMIAVGLFLYLFATLLYALSTFNCTRKEVTTYGEAKTILKTLEQKDVPFALCGEWAKQMAGSTKLLPAERAELVVDEEDLPRVLAALQARGFERDADLDSSTTLELYSDRYGYLDLHVIRPIAPASQR